ncbi:MAG: hypothetical protein DSZ03_05255 [Sulfurimonas sp.]|nr:MAG: hypothetical protein DSZ03_05255 [Sulfurimonas sp.]
MLKLKYNTPVLLLILVLSISYLSFFNYESQKKLLLTQMKSDAGDIVNSITAAMLRFQDIKSTMNLQKLVNNVSFGLEIFEFRYLEPDGIISNSMFKEEIGNIYTAASFKKTMQGEQELKEFFFETRDYVDVMAIYYPIYRNKSLIGMIDLAVDVSEYKEIQGAKENFALLRRQVDILNLLKAIEGSIANSLEIFEKTDVDKFLHGYVHSAENIVQISLIDTNNTVRISSHPEMIGTKLQMQELPPPDLVNIDGRLIYRTVVNSGLLDKSKDTQLMLLIDASPYAQNEQQLLQTALTTSAIALIFALIIARAIYYSAIERSRSEKERLEKLVKERTHEIEVLSKTDALTGLWNRGYLEEMLEMEFKRAKRYGHDISIMIIDLDFFKRINDTYGHMAGDEVLRQISRRISGCVRETDFVGRYGGEEIVVILPETSPDAAQNIAEGIRETIEKKSVVFESYTIEVTTSIGLSYFRREHTDYLTVFAEADKALYFAKEQGRNRVIIFDATIDVG